METETTLPGILTVPGELLQPGYRRGSRSRWRRLMTLAMLLVAVAVAAWAIWG